MIMRIVMRLAVSVLIVIGLASAAHAQIVNTSATFGPPKPETFMGKESPTARLPAADPRDLNGNYIPDLANAGLNVDTPSLSQPGAGSTAVPAQMACIPEARIDVSPYGGQIIQTPGRVSLIAEYNHVIRRIYLDSAFPDKIEPSYTGYSIGHWEGDTLVIETRGLKTASLAATPDMVAISSMTERIRKIDAGKRIEDVASFEGLDRNGKSLSTERSTTILWRSDIHLQEFICEDGAERFFTN